jgi:hypothetical protein
MWSFMAYHGDFRSTAVNGHLQAGRACLKGATSGSQALSYPVPITSERRTLGMGPWAGPQRAEPDATSQHHLDAADLWAHRTGGFKKLSLGLIRHITRAGPPLARINLSFRLGARSKSISNGGR